MQEKEIQEIIKKQNQFFATGATLPPARRITALKQLKAAIIKYEEKINAAIKEDLGKSAFESYMCEVGLVLSELSYMIKHTKQYAKEKTVITPLAQFASRSFKKPCPYGTVLIMSPWNYPFLLTIDPLVDAIAAGNTAVVKPSAYSPKTSAVIQELLTECFSPDYVAVITGGRAENQCLFQQKFDYIFFTGSQTVGREVMRHAAEHLTPVTLELGGKSPCIVDTTANIKLAARRIVFGKYLNCGQTCVAPDYVLCEASIKDALVRAIQAEIKKQFGEKPLDNPDYGKIINEKQYQRISGLIDQTKVVFGGTLSPATMQIEPTVMDNVAWEDAVMQEEIFGPIMPILTFTSLDEVIDRVNAGQKPLALYYFSQNSKNSKRIMARLRFGGGCINDTIIHLATSYMGFGGVGESGMGSYHGKDGFATFSHYKSIVDKKTFMDLPMRYQPYQSFYEKLIRMFLK